MEFLLLAASVAASTTRSLLSKWASSSADSLASFGRVNGVMSFFALIVITAYGLIAGMGGCSVFTVIMALLYAFFTLTAQLFYMRGLDCGDVSAVTFFYSCGFILPTFVGTFLYREPISLLRLVGIAVLVVAFWFCAGKSSAGDRARGRAWIGYAIAAMLSSGALGIIQKLHQSSAEYKGELGSFLVIAFAACTLASALMALIRSSAKPPEQTACNRFLPLCICGLCIGAANILNLFLSGALPALVFFPVVNGGVTVAASVAAIFIYGQKITRRRAAGLILGVAAILLIAC
ncbi:MAG: hypothetical protein IKD37_01360 [Clostridia bacterium]|nr:hypothetical protein [Clostridia bacterium]